MPAPPPEKTKTANIEADLDQVEKGLRILRIEYEQYFGGGRRLPPTDAQWRVDSLLKRYADRVAEMNYNQRFRYTNLSDSFAKYQDMWRKKLQQREEGRGRRVFGAAAREIEEQRMRLTGRPSRGGAEGDFAVRFSDPRAEEDKIRALFDKMMELRKQAGEKSGAPKYRDFVKFISAKTKEIQAENRGVEVEYRVAAEKDKVRLKAQLVS
ncbi:MAG: MXAN_5187 C-terminal domain-containing protein [Candidatus Acidiferrales bacterium]